MNQKSRSNPKPKKNQIYVKELEKRSISSDLDTYHIFKDPVKKEYYTALYETAKYECRHHLDPDVTWSQDDERRITWKNDWQVTFWDFIMFTALDFDRYNILQAVSDNPLDDLNSTTSDYNLGNTINLVCFLAAEIPSQLISKKLGADIWIPTQLVLWSIVSILQSSIKSKNGFLVTRTLIGALQGGFICDVCLWMSYFYTANELPFRMSLFYIANPLTTVWSSLLSFGLLKITADSVKEGWRWLFIIEGVFTLFVGIISYFKMPASVVETKARYRPSGWYTEGEEKILDNKILRDDPMKGSMHNRQPVSTHELFSALLDYDLWPVYIIRILADTQTAPVVTYLTLTLRELGFTTFATNALTIPYNILQIITLVILGYLCQKLKSKASLLATVPVWGLVCLFPLRYWPGSQVNVWGTYAILTILLGHAPSVAITISWCSENSNSVRSRAVSVALVNIFSQASGIISANINRPDDAPLYHRGNVVLIGFAFGILGACIAARYYYISRNKWKETKWNAMLPEEQETYFKTEDEGNKRLDFRFVY